MSAPTLILASASPARAALLRSAGVEPDIRPADVDEEAILAEAATAARVNALPVPEAVALLARAKAEAITQASHARVSDAPTAPAVVVGCDSLLELDGAGLGKPHTAELARQRWRRMRGRSGILHSGHHVIRLDSGAVAFAVSSTTVHFADLTDAEIDAYVDTGEPLAVAGAFTIDGLGGAFVTGVDGDPHGVVGLSLPLLRTMLASLDLAWVDLWHRRND
ncbi:Maf family protein [Ruania halotolerans]|uniref:Maf family protein n=1 Tax=Ruania halotolerans TaxID=2897773 RepID=UPI001E4665F6|nr:Maf family protein [Ruania halotolerans]UFU07505.1 Maf family nucleotide pyrophosphatase [Ruania halotolerans]